MTGLRVPADVLKSIERVCDIADETLTSENSWYPEVRYVRQWLREKWGEE